MPYATTEELAARLPHRTIIELCDDEGLARSAVSVDQALALNANISARLEAARTDAEGIIDAHLRSQVIVPLASPPTAIKGIAIGLWIAHLYQRRSGQFELPEAIVERRKMAMDALKALHDGDLDTGAEPPSAASSKVVATYGGAEAVFTAETLQDF